MQADKLRDLDVKELETQAGEAEAQLFHLRLQMGMGQLEGLKKYRALRKDRARMLTLLRQKQLAQTPAGGTARKG